MAKYLSCALIAAGLLLVGPQIQKSEASSWRRGNNYYNNYNRGYSRGYSYRYNYSPRYNSYNYSGYNNRGYNNRGYNNRGYNSYRGGNNYGSYYRGNSRPGVGFYYSF